MNDAKFLEATWLLRELGWAFKRLGDRYERFNAQPTEVNRKAAKLWEARARQRLQRFVKARREYVKDEKQLWRDFLDYLDQPIQRSAFLRDADSFDKGRAHPMPVPKRGNRAQITLPDLPDGAIGWQVFSDAYKITPPKRNNPWRAGQPQLPVAQGASTTFKVFLGKLGIRTVEYRPWMDWSTLWFCDPGYSPMSNAICNSSLIQAWRPA